MKKIFERWLGIDKQIKKINDDIDDLKYHIDKMYEKSLTFTYSIGQNVRYFDDYYFKTPINAIVVGRHKRKCGTNVYEERYDLYFPEQKISAQDVSKYDILNKSTKKRNESL